MFNKCCCCINLRPGAVVIASLDIFAALLSLVVGLLGVFIHKSKNVDSSVLCGIYFTTASIVSATSGCCLLGGVISRSASPILIYIIFSLIGLGLSVVYLFALILVKYHIFFSVTLAAHAIGIPLKVYFLLCAYSLYKEMKCKVSRPSIKQQKSTSEEPVPSAPYVEDEDYDELGPEDFIMKGSNIA